MDKKKIAIISVIAVAIIAIIIGTICFFVFNESNIENNENSNKIVDLYQSLKEKETYSFTTTLNDNNKEIYAKENNVAYTESLYDGNVSKYVIKDGNSYLVKDENKEYYTYSNNETDLNKVEDVLSEFTTLEYTEGKETINNKKYTYLEYNQETGFTMMSLADLEGSKEVKTRFYFSGDKLAYIKTIIDEKEELLKVDISDKVDSNLFEIPSNYKSK